MQMVKHTIQCPPSGTHGQDGGNFKDQVMAPSNFRFPPFEDPIQSDEPDRAHAAPPVLDSAPRPVPRRNRVSSVQLMAWSMANWGYQVPDGSIYRAEAVRLYQEDLHERIEALFADLDAQNARICAGLRAAA